MNSLRLALRVLRIDRRTRTSAILTAVGVAVATALVLLLAALPFATQARAQRAIWQEGYYYGHYTSSSQQESEDSDASKARNAVPMLMLDSKDYANGQEIARVDVALTGKGDAAALKPSPGLPGLPGPGQAYVSPALAKLIQADTSAHLGDRYGKVVGELGPEALKYPEQLVAFAGQSPDSIPESARPVTSFPQGKASVDGLLTLLAWVGIIVLLVPSLVLVASSARLTAARRERRLAAIRLAGATPGQVTGMVAAETTLSAAIGALAGLAVSPGLAALATFVPWDGGTWQTADFALPVGLAAALVVALPVLVVLAGVLGLRRVLKTPLFAAGNHTPKPLKWWRLLALPAAGLFFLYAISTSKENSNGMAMVMGGLFLLVGSAMVVGPWVTSAVGGTFVRIWRRPAALLAGRRLREDPKGAYRSSAGIVLAVFAGSMALTLLPTFESLAGGGRSFQDSVLYFDTDSAHSAQAVDQANAALAKYGQSARALPVATVSLVSGEGRSRQARSALVMPCAEAAKLTRFGVAGSCQGAPGIYGDAPVDLAQWKVTGDPGAQKLSAAAFAPNTPVHKITNADKDLTGSFIIDPAVLPAEVKPKYISVVAPTTDANREVVRTALVGAAGGELIWSREQRLHRQEVELGDLRRVTVIGLLAAGILAGCSAAVSTAGSVMDRRRTFGALIAAGTPVRVLAKALRMEAALPALVATIGAGAVGTLVGIGLFSLVDKGSIVLSPWIAAPVVLGVLVALLGASVCTPALKRVQAEPLADE
ncbi:FtsX-like permease family protein [Amycolatopsis sp. NPDC059021]|uniref:FtsX-like permease family protein n=1 Tax=Amycolatopsis sp. NPDC059021 TaxID=3346704 RepID=UPI003670EE77